MLYSKKYNLLFVAVPKTGTTSFTSALGDVLESERNIVTVGEAKVRCGEHDTLAEIAEKVGWDAVRNMVVVAAVRNPWDRLVSSYHFYRSGRVTKLVLSGKQRNPMAILNVLAARLLPFTIWVRLYRTKTCSCYLKDSEGALRIDHLLRLEYFEQDVAELCKALGLAPVALQQKNRSPRTHYREYYTPASQRLVAQRFSEDVEAFDYTY